MQVLFASQKHHHNNSTSASCECNAFRLGSHTTGRVDQADRDWIRATALPSWSCCLLYDASIAAISSVVSF
jgi:hypothetical protein